MGQPRSIFNRAAKRLLVGFACAMCAAAASAQNYPAKAVKLVVPFAPGGGVDLIGRLVGEAVSQGLGQPVVVENRPGAGAAIGAEIVARSAPDGYTLLIGTSSTHGVNSAVNPKLPYDAVKDFSPVILLATTPWMVVVTPSLPVRSPAELIAYAKAHPGKLNFASYGRGSSNHLATELLKAMAGIDVVHVPYKGSAPALLDVIAGQVHFMLDTYSTSAPHVQAGKIRLIGVTSAQPVSFAPGAPTVSASGLPGYTTGAFFAIFAPAKTPKPVVERLNREFNAALRQTAVKDRLTKLAFEPAGGPPEILGKKVVDEVRTWVELVKQQNLKFDN
jgi:tripartite-type tricarboxylate transporter receptor subunit TctC